MKSKKIVVIVLCVLVLLCGGGVYGYASTYSEGAHRADVSLTIAGQSVDAQKSTWHVPVLKGLFFLQLEDRQGDEPYDVGDIHVAKLPIANSKSYPMKITVTDEAGTTVFHGGGEKYQNFALTKNGTYGIAVEVIVPRSGKDAYGSLYFSIRTKLALEPKLATGPTKVVQGDVLALKLTDVSEELLPTVQTELGLSVFTKVKDGYQAFVPVGYMQKIGTYPVVVQAGSFQTNVQVEVVAGVFQKQHLTINKKNPVISEASSPKAYQQFRDTIHPFYQTADPTVYWNGKFMQPVQGRISTQFGLLRYTNGSTTPTGHSGIDIATAKGTPIVAPANGVVVFSDYLLNTGNTLVIEHGGGLKSYFYHMNSAAVKVGDGVTMGQPVGTVGTTGYSTGPHLHYEVRQGSQSLSPWNLFKGTGGFFTFQ